MSLSPAADVVHPTLSCWVGVQQDQTTNHLSSSEPLQAYPLLIRSTRLLLHVNSQYLP